MNIDKITSKFGFTFKRDLSKKQWLWVVSSNLLALIFAIVWTSLFILYFPIKLLSNLLNAIFHLILFDYTEAKYRLTEF